MLHVFFFFFDYSGMLAAHSFKWAVLTQLTLTPVYMHVLTQCTRIAKCEWALSLQTSAQLRSFQGQVSYIVVQI